MEARVSSASKEVIMADNRPTVIIGERIDPTGKTRPLPAWQSGRKSD